MWVHENACQPRAQGTAVVTPPTDKDWLDRSENGRWSLEKGGGIPLWLFFLINQFESMVFMSCMVNRPMISPPIESFGVYTTFHGIFALWWSPFTSRVPSGCLVARLACLSASWLFSLKTWKNSIARKVLISDWILIRIVQRWIFFGSELCLAREMISLESPTTVRFKMPLSFCQNQTL